MRVIPIAWTTFSNNDAAVAGWNPHSTGIVLPEEAHAPIDELAEFAGRNCYQAWQRKRPETATNKGYLNNIMTQGHFSVLEHGSLTFYVDGISRSLTHELIRHRHLSFSELSQRYVNMDEAEFVVPPLIRESLRRTAPEDVTDDQISDEFQGSQFFEDVQATYNAVVAELEEIMPEATRKQVREAARAVMPNCTETKIVVTGNIRAWRDVLHKRYHIAADAEIEAFAEEVLKHLRVYAPNSVQDFPEKPFE